MSKPRTTEEEQHEDLEDSHSSSKESSSDEFGGWDTGPRLQYRVDSDQEGRSQILSDIASGSHTEDLLDKSIQEVDEAWQDLEAIADRLGDLSPLRTEDTEWELAFFKKEKSDRSQGATAVSRDSLVSRRISHFEDLSAATMSFTTVTTSTTTTTTTSVAGSNMSAISAMINDPYGLNFPRHHLGAHALPAGGVDDIMLGLEFEVKFTKDELQEEFANTIADLEDDSHVEAVRLRKKAAVLVDMMGEEKKRDAYEHTLTYVCNTADEEKRKAVKRDLRKITSLINELKVVASDEGLVGAQAVHPIPPVPHAPVHHVHPYRTTKMTPLNLPKWNGDIAKFKAFNTNFDGLIRNSGIPEEFWGVYLYEHLDDQIKAYAGSSTSWQGKYDQLWDLLKSRYANRWTVAAETVKATIMSNPPEEKDWGKMVQYIDDQIDRMQSIEALDLTNVQLATNVLLMKLPEDFSNAIRNGLRIARKDKGNEDFKFTPEEFREVMNDTVMSWKTTQPHLVESTMALQATIPPSGHQSSHSSSQGKKSNKKGYKPQTSNMSEYCALCDTTDHITPRCAKYVGAADRRSQLSKQNKCPDCTRTHKGNCRIRFGCRTCNGNHLDYLCPGQKKPNATK